MDMDYARRIARAEASDGDDVEQPVADLTPLRYGPIEQRLDDLTYTVLLARAAIYGGRTKDGQEPSVAPPRRPWTALDAARQEIEFEELDRITAEVFGGVMPS